MEVGSHTGQGREWHQWLAAVSLNFYLLNQETKLRASGRCWMEVDKERDIDIVKDAFHRFARILSL